MNATKAKAKNVGILLIILIILVILGVYNCFSNATFWDSNITSLLTLGVAVVITFYLVQRNTDYRKQKDVLIRVLLDIRTFLADPSIYKITSSTPDWELTLRNRSIFNRIDLLKSCAAKFGISEDVDFIEAKFSEYDTIISDHIQNISELSAMSRELKRPIDLIINRTYQAEMTLYK